eukprot:4814889-Amphidinium_carterae.1
MREEHHGHARQRRGRWEVPEWLLLLSLQAPARRTETSSLAHRCLEQPARAIEGLQHDLWPGHDWQPYC